MDTGEYYMCSVVLDDHIHYTIDRADMIRGQGLGLRV
jgi:hypothetical protein